MNKNVKLVTKKKIIKIHERKTSICIQVLSLVTSTSNASSFDTQKLW